MVIPGVRSGSLYSGSAGVGRDMKCLYFDGGLRYIESFQRPAPQAGEALIRVILAGVCSTDLQIIRGYKSFKGIPGHEFVGLVEESPHPALTGKRVVAGINIGCGSCSFCRAGRQNHCRQRRVPGIIGKDGALAEYLTMPVDNLHVVPDGISDNAAVFAEPLAAALEVTEKFHVRPSSRVAVLGDGKLGQLVARVLGLTGCKLTVVGKHREKLLMLKDVATAVNLPEADFEGHFDLVVDCTGNSSGLKHAQAMVKPEGTVIMKSTYHGEAFLSPSEWVVGEITLAGSRCGPMDAALRLLEKKLVDVEPLISGVFRLEDWERAFSPEISLKALFNPGWE